LKNGEFKECAKVTGKEIDLQVGVCLVKTPKLTIGKGTSHANQSHGAALGWGRNSGRTPAAGSMWTGGGCRQRALLRRGEKVGVVLHLHLLCRHQRARVFLHPHTPLISCCSRIGGGQRGALGPWIGIGRERGEGSRFWWIGLHRFDRVTKE
jgi:hypothetical protein